MNKCLCEEVQPHIIKVNLACPIHGKPEEVKECECVCHGNHPKYKRFLGMYCTHCAPEHLKPSPAKKEPTEREELHWQQMKHACHAHTLDEDQKWEVIERNVKDLLERERQVTRASTLLEAMKTTREYRAKEKEPTGWESTDKFMELAMKFKQWFQDEEIALADQEALENQKQKVREMVENRMLTIKWLWNKEGTDLDKLLMVQVQMNYLLQEIEKI